MSYNLISEELFKEFTRANLNLQNGHKEPMDRFKLAHPDEYKNITKCWRKRSILYDCINALFSSCQDVYWGALTFDNEHDNSTIENKRKQAIRHLNKCFSAWVMVEEFGSDKERYHIHFIAIFKYDKTIITDFASWHSREDIEKVLIYKKRKTVKYLTDYLEKQAPRLRKSKNMIAMLNEYKKAKKLQNLQFNHLANNCVNNIIDIALGSEYFNDLPF